jgi:hypothetical protein
MASARSVALARFVKLFPLIRLLPMRGEPIANFVTAAS